jgi:regulator of cell morphogenesis and NO signaling
MSKHLTLNEGIKGNLKKLELYVPVVARVHGGHHPEFHEVRKLYDEIVRKLGEGSEKPDLSEEFGKIRVITDNYTVPGDVCESYEAVYNMLAELEEAFKEVV